MIEGLKSITPIVPSSGVLNSDLHLEELVSYSQSVMQCTSDLRKFVNMRVDNIMGAIPKEMVDVDTAYENSVVGSINYALDCISEDLFNIREEICRL